MHIKQFPKETQDFIHELIAKAIIRAIRESKNMPTGKDVKNGQHKAAR